MPIFTVTTSVGVLGLAQKRIVTRDIDAVDAAEAVRKAQTDLVTVEVTSVVKQ